MAIGILVALAACSPQPEEPMDIFAAVDDGNTEYVTAWIKNGGNPNTRTDSGGSLLYIATGPHGGHQVLTALLDGGADPDLGHGRFTPLMNVASWADLEGVRILLARGANPNLRSEDGKIALQLVSRNAGHERPVIEELQWATLKSNQ